MLRLLNQGMETDADDNAPPEREGGLSEWITKLLLKSGTGEINESYSFKKINRY